MILLADLRHPEASNPQIAAAVCIAPPHSDTGGLDAPDGQANTAHFDDPMSLTLKRRRPSG
jgi:hypothetical protein